MRRSLLNFVLLLLVPSCFKDSPKNTTESVSNETIRLKLIMGEISALKTVKAVATDVSKHAESHRFAEKSFFRQNNAPIRTADKRLNALYNKKRVWTVKGVIYDSLWELGGAVFGLKLLPSWFALGLIDQMILYGGVSQV